MLHKTKCGNRLLPHFVFYLYENGTVMKKILLFIAFVLASSFAFALQEKQPENIAIEYLNLLKAEKFDEAAKMSDTNMVKLLGAEKLREFWLSLKVKYGKVNTLSKPEQIKSNEFFIYSIILYTDKDSLNARISINKKMEIAGLFFIPIKKNYDYSMPDYVDTTKFVQKNVEFGEIGWQLPATLTLPKNGTKFPLVILVHGSGPHDRDETIGPNKPFRDIALGLATNGIAVLRYEKRTKYYQSRIGKEYNNFTIEKETVDDAVEAVKFASTLQEIDPKQIYVLGHSQGGYMMPKIIEKSEGFKGSILLAGSARPLYELILDQYNYILKSDGSLEFSEIQEIKKVEQQIAYLKSESFSENSPTDSLLLRLPAKYWANLLEYNPIKIMKENKKKVEKTLILQGETDYQVTIDDYKLWHDAFGKDKSFSFKLYPKLSHLFAETEGKSKPSDYDKKSYVNKQVIIDIVEWIKNSK